MKPIVSRRIRVRHPEHFRVGEGSVVDDFSYFSARVRIGRHCHVASGCSVGGGAAHRFTLGDYSSLSAGVRIWCVSDDFVNDLVVLVPPGVPPFKKRLLSGDVTFGRYTAVGANSVVMPGNRIPDGTVIGALSFVPPGFRFLPWSVYAGIPVRRLGVRNRRAVEAQVRAFDAALRRRGAGRG